MMIARILSIAVLVCAVSVSAQIQCLDEYGGVVDWWVMYKTPIISGHSDGNIAGGRQYMYMDSSNQRFRASSVGDISLRSGALYHTVQQMYSNRGSSSIGYMFFSDSPPVGSAPSSRGHIKGGLIFGNTTGIRISHSIPRFPEMASSGWSYPSNGYTNGQHGMCVSLRSSSIDIVGQELQYDYPYVFEYNFPTALRNQYPNLYKVTQGEYISSNPNYHIASHTSPGGLRVTTFAKGANWDSNLYQSLIASHYRSDMYVQTWTNGAGGRLPSFCKPQYSYNVENVLYITLDGDMHFTQTKDHSKWAVTRSGTAAACFCDINRMESQYKRGGGCWCLENSNIRNEMTSTATDLESC